MNSSSVDPIVPNSSKGDKGEGNTSSSPLKQISPAKRWCFTLNNYKDDDIEHFKFYSSRYLKCIIGKEVAETGTPHLQGYIYFKKKIRPLSLFKQLGAHWQKAKGSCKENFVYCTKEGDVCFNTGFDDPLDVIPHNILRDDQQAIVNMFTEKCPPIWEARGLLYWFWEPKGGWGKSVTCLWMVHHMNAMVLEGANKDILCGFKQMVDIGKTPKIVIFDIPRCNLNHVSYQAIEKIKNGYFFSGKYESSMCKFNVPHVLCFANEEPEIDELSEDRWKIIRLDQ